MARVKIAYKLRWQIRYLIYMYRQDLALNNLQGKVHCKTQPTNQPTVTVFSLLNEPEKARETNVRQNR